MTQDGIRISAAFCLAFLIVLLAFSPIAAQHGKKGMNLYLDGLELYESGHYQSALDKFADAIGKDSSNLQFQYYFGLTHSALGRNMEAVSIFSAILNKDSKNYPNVYFDLAGVYTRLKQYKKAMKVLNDAEWIVPDSSRIYLEKGYISKNIKDYRGALNNFNRAVELDPGMEQIVCYNKGLVYMDMGDLDKAEELFQRAVEIDPETNVGKYAKTALGRMGAIKRAGKPWHVYAMLGYSYDDNIPNNPLDRPGHEQVTDLGDQYQIFTLNSYYTLLKKNKFGLDAGYMVTYIRYNDSDNESSFGNSPYIQCNYTSGPWYGELKYSFSYYMADTSSKLVQHSIVPALSYSWPRGMRTAVTLTVNEKDYRDHFTPDTTTTVVSLSQFFNIPSLKMRPVLGMRYGDDDAENDASAYSYMELMAGSSMDLPYKVTGDISITDIRSDYKGEREDSGYLVSLSFSRFIAETMNLRLTYMYVSNDSNITSGGYDPYEYEKNIVQILAEVNL